MQKIYELKSLLQHRITVESPRPRKVIVQCMRCQQYGHARTYCTQPPVCVKCGQEHDNRDCPKTQEDPPKCGLCGGNHTVNYRGCEEFLKIKNRIRSKQIRSLSRNIPIVGDTATALVGSSNSGNITYAQAVNSQTSSNTSSSQTNSEQLLQKLNNQFEALMLQNQKLLELLIKLVTKLT